MNQNNTLALDAPKIIYQSPAVAQVTDQCDACSSIVFMKMANDSEDLENIPLTVNPGLIEHTINATYWIVLSPQMKNMAVLNNSARSFLHHFATPQTLADIPPAWPDLWGNNVVKSISDQMIELGLLVSEDCPTPTLIEAPEVLTAWLHITDRCNLRCSYCYLPHDQVDMSLETGLEAINATFRSAEAGGYRAVKLKYAGGEAMLRFPFIVELHQYAQTVASQHNLRLDGVILSNGTVLKPEIIKIMQSLGLRLMISLDGLGDYHNSQRFYANGRGSARDVTQTIEFALEHGLIPDISITLTGRNAEGLPELISWILERDLPFSLNFYRENECSITHADLQLEEQKIVSSMLAAFKVIEANLPRRSLLASLVDRANLATPHLRTCSVGHSYLVFDHLGQVSKCQMEMNKPLTTARADDPLAVIRADKSGIQNISVEEKEGCRNCAWKYWCAGGCPLTTYRATGRYDLKSPNCNIYRAIYPEVVHLEGLRLLEYADESGVHQETIKPIKDVRNSNSAE